MNTKGHYRGYPAPVGGMSQATIDAWKRVYGCYPVGHEDGMSYEVRIRDESWKEKKERLAARKAVCIAARKSCQ